MQLGLFMCWYHFARRTAEFSEHTNNINYLPISMVPSIIMFSCYALQVFFLFKDFFEKGIKSSSSPQSISSAFISIYFVIFKGVRGLPFNGGSSYCMQDEFKFYT